MTPAEYHAEVVTDLMAMLGFMDQALAGACAHGDQARVDEITAIVADLERRLREARENGPPAELNYPAGKVAAMNALEHAQCELRNATARGDMTSIRFHRKQIHGLRELVDIMHRAQGKPPVDWRP